MSGVAPQLDKERSPSPSSPPPTEPTSTTSEPNPVPDDEPSPSTDPPGIIEMETLKQILDLDEDDTHEFSRGMAWAYFSQAEETFQEMDEAYDAQDLPKLSSLGHFLKGSSAALGISKVQASCEQVQHYGVLRDEELGQDLSPEEALAKIQTTLARVKIEYTAAERWLKDYYKRLEAASNESV